MRLIFLIIFFWCYETSAQYISALPNNNLKEELNQQKDRLIPSHNSFNAAVDGLVYLRGLGSSDFYHGIGHWTQVRTEARLEDHARVNTRSIFYTGSNSNGYTQGSENYHLFGFTGILPEYIKGLKVSGRAKDLERQDVGRGLILQQEELDGFLIRLEYAGFVYRFIKEGTSGFKFSGDLTYDELSFWNERLGIGSASWYDDQDKNDNAKIVKDYYYVFSDIDFASRWNFQSEIGLQNRKYSYFFALNFNNQYISFKAQYRRYEDGFLDEYVGNIQHLYTSLDQLDKEYTNPLNILLKDNDVDVYSLKLDFKVPLSQLISLLGATNIIKQFINNKSKYIFRTMILMIGLDKIKP